MNAMIEQLGNAFAAQFPMTGMQDNAEDNMNKCKQKSDINNHIRTYNSFFQVCILYSQK